MRRRTLRALSLATLCAQRGVAALLVPSSQRCRGLTMQFDPAVAAEAAAASPQDPVAHYQLGLAHLASGSAADAASSLRRSLELGMIDHASWHDDPLGPYHAAGDALLEAREYAAAEECWRHSLQLDGGNVAVHERLAATLRHSGQLAAAADALHDTLVLLGEEEEEEDEEEEGEVYVVAGDTEEGEDDEAAEVRCWLWMDLGAVIEDVAPIVGTGAEWPGAAAPSAPPQVRVGSLAPERLSAEACYRRAVSLGGGMGEPHKRLADVLAYAEGAEAARPHFERAAQLLPHDICCATHVFYGTGAAEHGRPRPALPLPPRAAEGAGGGAAAGGLGALQVEAEGEGWAARAAEVFEAQGVVVLPSLLADEAREALRGAVEQAADGPDFTSETREAGCREHRALAVRGAAEATLSAVLTQLWPLLATLLQAEAAPLLGAGYMRVGPGAEAQELHKDVHGHDRHAAVEEIGGPGGAARAVSIQLQLSDTTPQPDMGSLVVLPGSHRPDAASARPEQIKRAVAEPTAENGVVAVAVPPGTVTLYSSRLWHCGGANRSDRQRTFCFLTVCEPDAPAPAGLIHTMEMEDVGAWVVDGKGLQPRAGEVEKREG